jgi:iron complex transport system substrate-binding protein
MMNLPYGDSWHQPSSQSLIVSLIEDAGFNYLYHDSSTTENHTFTLEQAWSDGAKADFWIIIASRDADFSKSKLIQEQEVYESFKSVQENQVIFCNSATTGYFTRGILEPEIMLQELIDIREQKSAPSNSYFNLLK